jgi:hypothetical protein
MKYLLIAMLIFGSPLMAKSKKKHPQAQLLVTAVPTPSPLAPPWDKVTLKDGQQAEGKIRGYDSFFLEFESKNATKFHIPWIEVSDLAPAEFSGDSALMRQYLKTDQVEVQTFIQAKNPHDVRMIAAWPGFMLHGSGYRAAGDNDSFLSLAGLELFGVGIGLFGLGQSTDTAASASDQSVSQGLMIAGGSIFLITWVWDLVGSGYAAESFNSQHGLSLSFAPTLQGNLMTAQLRF